MADELDPIHKLLQDPQVDLSTYYLTHRWARLLPGPLAYDVGSHSFLKGTFICGWMPDFCGGFSGGGPKQGMSFATVILMSEAFNILKVYESLLSRVTLIPTIIKSRLKLRLQYWMGDRVFFIFVYFSWLVNPQYGCFKRTNNYQSFLYFCPKMVTSTKRLEYILQDKAKHCLALCRSAGDWVRAVKDGLKDI